MRIVMGALAGALLSVSAAISAPVLDDGDCTLVVEATDGAVVHRDGACDARHTPASTFKVALALIGFDAGILQSPEAPVWDPPADADRVKEPTDPAKWLALSVVWYSQHLVADLGAERFAAAVERLDYGNADVSGDPGAGNGLLRSWIDSSLAISPDEQVAFLRRMLAGELPVSADAVAKTEAAMPAFSAEGWQVRGKTGLAFHRDASGVPNSADARAWFVGWAERDGRRVVFARFVAAPNGEGPPLSVAVRDSVLRDLPALAANPTR